MSKNKGMSRGGRLLALLAVLAVLCGGYFVVTNMTQKEAVIETGGSFEVAGLTPDEITSMAWQNGDETIRLVRADGVWSLDGEVTTRISIAFISDFLSKLMRLPISFFDVKMLGDIMQRIGDNSRIQSFLTGTLISMVFSAFTFVIYSIIMASYHAGKWIR